MTDKTDALVLVSRSQLIELQAEVSDDASLAHERIRSILAAPAAPKGGVVDEAKACEWTYDDSSGAWETSCGRLWAFNEGGPDDNRCTYCHGCGQRVRVLAVGEQP